MLYNLSFQICSGRILFWNCYGSAFQRIYLQNKKTIDDYTRSRKHIYAFCYYSLTYFDSSCSIFPALKCCIWNARQHFQAFRDAIYPFRNHDCYYWWGEKIFDKKSSCRQRWEISLVYKSSCMVNWVIYLTFYELYILVFL